MTDDSFAKAGRWAAYCAAALSILYALSLAVGSAAADGALAMVATAAANRVLNSSASWLLAATGLATTLVVMALASRDCASAAWMRWAGGLGFVGAALMTVHGLYDAYRVPVLLAQWEMDLPGRQAAISAFAGVPNPVDPKGVASLLFVGLFALTAAVIVAGPSAYRRLGVLHGAVLVGAFAAGAIAVLTGASTIHTGYLVLGWLGFAVTGPLWWIAVARLSGEPSTD
jgi:hypothetical protein